MPPETCKICDASTAKYTCPRCNIYYCSLNCYKNPTHILCSESFYRDCISQEIATLEPDDEAKAKMMDILNKINREEDPQFEDISEEESLDSDDAESVPDLEVRLKNIDLDDSEKVWEALTEDERREFEAMLSHKDVTTIIPPWEPWWLYRETKKLVVEVDKSEDSEVDYAKNCPPILQGIPEFSSLSKTKPSSSLSYNLMNILSSYIFMVRYYNGDHHLLNAESATLLYSICNNLKVNANFEDTRTAFESIMHECTNNPSIEFDSSLKKTIQEDIVCIIKGPNSNNSNYYILSALSDIHKMMNDLKKLQKDSKKDGAFAKRFPCQSENYECSVPKEKIKTVLKKLEFYLSYVKTYNCDFMHLRQ